MGDYLNTAGSDWFKQRISGIMYVVLVAFLILISRLFYLQLIQGQEYRRLSESNSIRLKNIDPARGLIFDRNGILLVENRPSFDLSIIVKDAKPLEETVEKLSRYIDVPVSEFMTKIRRGKGIALFTPILLKHDIGRDALAAIEVHKFDLPGVLVDVRPLRHYINKQSAAHLIGYLGEINSDELDSGRYPEYRGGDYIGKFGIEKAYEKYLWGKRGGRQVEVNATGRVVRVLNTVDAQPGRNIHLTIDQRLQEEAELKLKSLSGAVVAMDPSTGAVLAMASSPSFDQNAFIGGISATQWEQLRSDPNKPMANKAIQGEYPPASTYKIITALAGLEEGVIDETTAYNCPGYYRYGDRVFRCWKKGGHGTVEVVKAIAESCDVFFYQVGQSLGIDRLAWYAKACGLGVPTGIDLDHEERGLIPTAAWKKQRTGVSWQGGETLSVAIGQGYNAVTPLQMAVLISAVANGGKRYKPMIYSTIETPDGKTVSRSEPVVMGELPVKPETLALVQKGLFEVVQGRTGTARGSRIKGIKLCGKTGTAQVISRKKNETEKEEDARASHLKAHAWFLAYAPSEAPRIAVSVIVEHGEHGSSAAAPIASALIRTYLVKE